MTAIAQGHLKMYTSYKWLHIIQKYTYSLFSL